MNQIPFMADFGGNKSIFNGDVYAELMEYFFFTVLCKYTYAQQTLVFKSDMVSSSFSVESVEEEQRGESNYTQESLDEGQQETLHQKIANLIYVYMDSFQKIKKSMNKNNDDIREKILKQKEKEKVKFTQRLSNMSIEERLVETELQKHKLGVWSKGLSKSLFQYSPEEWDMEYAELEKTAQQENRLNQRDDITTSTFDILRFDIEQQDSISRRLNAENLSLSNVLNSEDNEGEQD
jgi:thiol:disulfide interchange protein